MLWNTWPGVTICPLTPRSSFSHLCLLSQQPQLMANMATSQTKPWTAPPMRLPHAVLGLFSSRLSLWRGLCPNQGPEAKP